MAARFLTVRDPETDQVVKIEVTNDSVSAAAFAKVALTPTTPTSEDPNEKVPLRLYDPGFKNTAVCKSKISHIDPAGKLFYRGYDIEELFEKSTFLEVAFLLIYGELPTAEELTGWTQNIMKHTYLHSQLERQMLTFRYDAHPMGMMIATIASLSTFSPEANPAIVSHGMYMMPKSQNSDPDDLEMNDISLVIQNRNKVIYRALGKVPTISSAVYRHRLGRNYNHPMFGSLNYCENLLYMMDKLNEPNYKPDPRLVKILDKLFILIAEHGVTCSTGMLRHLASSGVDPYTALSGAAGALFGERKSASVISMLSSLKSIEEIDEFLQSVKSSNCSDISAGNDPKNVKSKILMGFGHRIYNSFDPRVILCKKLVEEVIYY
jgi:citrate synthase